MSDTGLRAPVDPLTIQPGWDPGPVERVFLIAADLEAYQRWHVDGYALGWDGPSGEPPELGRDLVVDVCRLPEGPRVVAGASMAASYADPDWLYDDWFRTPPLTLSDVLEAAGLPPRMRLPATLDGERAQNFVRALMSIVADPPPVYGRIEGGIRDRRMRERSAALRFRKLLSHDGRCEACGVVYGSMLNGLAAAVFDVHHLQPLAQSPGLEVRTTEDDLAVLCANCHRLAHAAAVDGVPLSPDELQARLSADS